MSGLRCAGGDAVSAPRSLRAGVVAALLLLAGCAAHQPGAGPGAPVVRVPADSSAVAEGRAPAGGATAARDTTLAPPPAADSSRTAADTTKAAPPPLTAAQRDSVARARAALQPKPRRSKTGVPEPPLQFSADNMSGTHDESGDIVLLNGNVRITRARTVITADNGRYLREPGMLYLDGRVKLVDSTTTLNCEHATYSEKEDMLEVQGSVEVHDRDAVLEAPFGTYARKTGVAELSGGVKGRDKKQRITCDHATYDREAQVLHARGQVHGLDEESRIELTGDAIDYDRNSKWAEATGDPLLRVKDEDGKSADVRARRLRLNTETRFAEAIDSVRVVRDSLQARSDLATFDDALGRGWLTGNPRAWDPETAVEGDTLELWSKERKLERIVVRSGATVDYAGGRAENQGETSKLTGDRVDAFVTKNALDSLVAIGDARNFYTAPAKPKKTAETNLATGDTITVFFKDRKIELARVTGNAKGEYHPPADTAAAADTAAISRDRIRYDARKIEFVVPKSRIVLDEKAHLTYRDLELNSRRVEYDVEKQALVASGSPELLDRGDKVDGHLMTYDLSTRVGTIYQAETAYERGLYHGEAIRKVNESELDVSHGDYTTCSLDQPHYHFSARWMKIYLKDKLVAKPVVFYLRNVPVLALPFWVFPIKPGRHSGFLFPQFEFGFNNQAGQFIRNAGYYWAPNDYMDFTASGDYYQAEPSWVLRGEGVYKKLYVMDGSVNGTYARNEAIKHDDYDLNAQHFQQISPRTTLTGQASFVSSRDYNSSVLFGRTLEQRLNRFLTSSLALSHNADWASFNAVIDRRQDLDAETNILDPDGAGPLSGPAVGTFASGFNVQSTAPNLSIGFPTRTIGSLGFFRDTPWAKRLETLYLSLNSSFVNLHTERGFVARRDSVFDPTDSVVRAVNVLGVQKSTRRAFGSSFSMSDSRRAFGWINVSPSLNGQLAVFDFDEAGNQVVPAASWSAGVTTSSTFYGLFRPNWGPITGIRHVVFPSASFSYSPEIARNTLVQPNGSRIPRFDPVGGIGVSSFKQAFLSFGVDQRLQVKLKNGDKITRLDNLVSMSLRSSYNFLWKEQRQLHPFSPVGGSFVVTPPGALSFTANFTADPYSQRPLRNFSFYSGYSIQKGLGKASKAPALPTEQTSASTVNGFAEDWSAQFAYSYAGGYSNGPDWSSAQTLNMVGRMQFSPAWGLEYSTQVDLVNRHVGTQRFGITRDLHCWTASFTRTFNQGGEAEYYFRLGVKDLKELYVERGTRTGSIGGIQ